MKLIFRSDVLLNGLLQWDLDNGSLITHSKVIWELSNFSLTTSKISLAIVYFQLK